MRVHQIKVQINESRISVNIVTTKNINAIIRDLGDLLRVAKNPIKRHRLNVDLTSYRCIKKLLEVKD